MAGEKILLADDDRQLRETLRDFLAGQRYEVTAASDGHEAMAALQEQEFALALLDLMPVGRDLYPYLESIMDSLKFDAVEAVLSATLGFALYAAMFG